MVGAKHLRYVAGPEQKTLLWSSTDKEYFEEEVGNIVSSLREINNYYGQQIITAPAPEIDTPQNSDLEKILMALYPREWAYDKDGRLLVRMSPLVALEHGDRLREELKKYPDVRDFHQDNRKVTIRLKAPVDDKELFKSVCHHSEYYFRQYCALAGETSQSWRVAKHPQLHWLQLAAMFQDYGSFVSSRQHRKYVSKAAPPPTLTVLKQNNRPKYRNKIIIYPVTAPALNTGNHTGLIVNTYGRITVI